MDEILDRLGPWHYPILVLNAVGGLSYSWRVMAMKFMAPKDVDYWCARPNDSISLEDWRSINDGVDLHCYTRDYSDSLDGNISSSQCNAWEFDHTNHARTLIEEWEAVCGREQLLNYSQSLLMAGRMGTLLFSQLADWYGRRRTVLLSFLLCSITGFGVAATSTFWSFSIARMVNFAVTTGVNTLALESVGAGKRAMMVMVTELQWLVGLFTFPLVTYFVRDWRWIQIISTAPGVVFFVWTLFVDESPKWLISSRRYDEARKVLEKVVKRNKLKDVNVNSIVDEARAAIEEERTTQGRASIIDLFRRVFIIKITAICVLNHITMAFLYYYLLYFTVDLGTNPYLNLVFTALTEAPVNLLSYFVLKYLRRKPVYNIAYPLTIVSLASLLVFQDSSTTVRVLLSSVAKLSGQVTWCVLWVHTSEVYPTPVRAIASGLVHIGSRAGAITAPLMHSLDGTPYAWISIASTVGMCLFGWSTTILLPETFGHSLPDTFHESKLLLRTSKDKNDKHVELDAQRGIEKNANQSKSQSPERNAEL